MLNSLSLENFKCFKKTQTFELDKVNVFSGYNGRGKSSVMQSLLLLTQSFQHNGNVETLEVNGDLVHLGVLKDLAFEGKMTTPIRITLQSDAKDADVVKLGYGPKPDLDRQGQLVELKISADGVETDYFEFGRDTFGNEPVNKEVHELYKGYPTSFHELFKNVFFTSADRKGPSLYEEKQDLRPYNPIGKNGEYILNVIASDKGLQNKISEVISEIMDGGEISLSGVEKDNLVLGLNLKIGAGSHKSFKSINCGFGYSYILPIVVNALTMTSGMLFIENPEAHLHPKAQSCLIKFLCKELGEKDVQLFVETHSEHILNAVRLCVVRSDYATKEDDVSLYFFDRDFSCKKLKMDKDAQIDNWPEGFFDQEENDLSEILKLGLLK